MIPQFFTFQSSLFIFQCMAQPVWLTPELKAEELKR